MIPYYLIHLALPTLHLEPHKQIVLHLSSLPLLMQVPSCASTGIESTTSGVPLRRSCPPGPSTRHTCSYDPVFTRNTVFQRGAQGLQDFKGFHGIKGFRAPGLSRFSGLGLQNHALPLCLYLYVRMLSSETSPALWISIEPRGPHTRRGSRFLSWPHSQCIWIPNLPTVLIPRGDEHSMPNLGSLWNSYVLAGTELHDTHNGRYVTMCQCYDPFGNVSNLWTSFLSPYILKKMIWLYKDFKVLKVKFP